ncbi:MAG: hypothetical protein K1X79_06885 [Oligoflexia bacterium]|nr:hypothetical protein [Oligoflexia bacterium]
MKSSTPNLSGIYAYQVELIGGSNRTQGVVNLQSWTPRQRLARSLKAMGACWGIALVCLFIPILHFILVPILFLAGLIVQPLYMKQSSRVLGGQGTCPFCAADFDVAATADRWPLRDICAKCHRHVQIVKL